MANQKTSAWGDLAKRYDIHEEAETFAQISKIVPRKLLRDTTLEINYSYFERANKLETPSGPFYGFVSHLNVPSTTLKAGIPIIAYKPALLSTANAPGILLFFHGGGLVFGSAASYASVPRHLATVSGMIVVIVDYRVLPNADDPLSPITDCITATRWVIDNPREVGGATDSKVGVAGDSAGGLIVSIVCNQVKAISCQVIIYGMLDLDGQQPCVKEFHETPGFCGRDYQHVLDLILPAVPHWRTNDKFNPTAIQDLSGQPPALVIAAELDPLRDCNVTYADRLEKAGVPTSFMMFKGLPHVFMFMRSVFPESYGKGFDAVAAFVKLHLDRRSKL